MVIGSFPDLCVGDVAGSLHFYQRLLDLQVTIDLGWYAELAAGGRVVLALVRSGHETIPIVVAAPPRGLLVSFEVDEIVAPAAAAIAMNCEFVAGPVDELGQRHFMVSDPDGTIVDVIERIPMTLNDRRRLAHYRREHRIEEA